MENAIWDGKAVVAYEIAKEYKFEKQIRISSQKKS